MFKKYDVLIRNEEEAEMVRKEFYNPKYNAMLFYKNGKLLRVFCSYEFAFKTTETIKAKSFTSKVHIHCHALIASLVDVYTINADDIKAKVLLSGSVEAEYIEAERVVCQYLIANSIIAKEVICEKLTADEYKIQKLSAQVLNTISITGLKEIRINVLTGKRMCDIMNKESRGFPYWTIVPIVVLVGVFGYGILLRLGVL